MTKNNVDALFIIPPIKPVPRPLDLSYTFFEKLNTANNCDFVFIQVGPLSIINMLENQGYSVKFFDFNHFKSKDTLKDTIKSLITLYDPKMVLAYSYTACIPGLKKCFKLFKKQNPNIYTIVGGQHVTFLDFETFKEFGDALNFIVRGEGEKTIIELCKNLFNGKNFEKINGITYKTNSRLKRNQDRKLMTSEELKNLPNLSLKSYPQEELSKPLYYSINISRGCPYNCIFCSNPRFWDRRLRFRPINQILEDISFLNDNHNVYFEFGDSNLPINKKIFQELTKKFQKELKLKNDFGMILIRSNLVNEERMEMIKRFTKDSPSAYITVGLENSDPKVLKIIKKPNWNIQYQALKKIKEYEMRSIPSWIVGLPGENLNTMTRNISMLNKLNEEKLIESTILFMFTPLPGTPPFHETEKYGLFIHHYNWEYFDRAIFPPPFSIKDIETGDISLTSEQIWNYWLFMVETQKRWRKNFVKSEKIPVDFKKFLRFMKKNPFFYKINPSEGKINLFTDFK